MKLQKKLFKVNFLRNGDDGCLYNNNIKTEDGIYKIDTANRKLIQVENNDNSIFEFSNERLSELKKILEYYKNNIFEINLHEGIPYAYLNILEMRYEKWAEMIPLVDLNLNEDLDFKIQNARTSAKACLNVITYIIYIISIIGTLGALVSLVK